MSLSDQLKRRSIPWVEQVRKKWKSRSIPPLEKQGAYLKRGIRALDEARPLVKQFSQISKDALAEQPFDAYLLECSPLYRRSRQLYLKEGGKFIATLVSSPRSLSSSILLDELIEYSPIARELIWSAIDPIESRHLDRLLKLRAYTSSLFHEQNHRILWRLLPPPPTERHTLQRYLNFAESLVITLDMALADSLGPQLASLFYLIGVIYDPGTSIQSELKSAREYRNYLQASLHATYLNLELYNVDEIPGVISVLFPQLGHYAERAAARSLNLDRAFVENTNPIWQEANHKMVAPRLTKKTKMKSKSKQKVQALILPDDPLNQVQQYLLAEKFFDLLGLP